MDHLGTKKDVASICKVSPRTIDTWVWQKRIPFIRLSSKCVRFNLAEVAQFLEERKVNPVN